MFDYDGLRLVALVSALFVVWVVSAAWAFSRIFATQESEQEPPESDDHS